jgi:predicted enzyme related to lactoylglutathione lyase
MTSCGVARSARDAGSAAAPRRSRLTGLRMLTLHHAQPGGFCWLDLAASDAARAKIFYAQAFGWTFLDQQANGGQFTRWRAGGQDGGSLYQLRQAQLESGVPSHWTPYIRVESAGAAAHHATACGGRLVVAPFDVAGTARIALIEDAVGALVGLWEPAHEITSATEVLRVAGGDGR